VHSAQAGRENQWVDRQEGDSFIIIIIISPPHIPLIPWERAERVDWLEPVR
jgi:hypothetical protein